MNVENRLAAFNKAVEILKAAPDLLTQRRTGKDAGTQVIDFIDKLGEYLFPEQSTNQPPAS